MSERPILRHLMNLRAGFDENIVAPAGADTCVLGQSPSPQEPEAIWIPTCPSTGSRRPSRKGKGSVRGSLVDKISGREIVFESRLERGFAEMLLARRDVCEVFDQPPAVHYVAADGRQRSHTFDFLVVTTRGIRLAMAVKAAAKVERSGIEETLELIRQQVGSHFADTYLLRTDQHITPDRVYNARLILRSRHCRDDSNVDTVWAIIGNLAGVFRIADVVMHSKLGARGFNSLVCLIDDGRLEPVVTGRIGYLTSVRRVSGQ